MTRSPEARLKVTGISTRVVNAALRNWIFVRVDTDQPGLYGWGEATLEWKTRAVVARWRSRAASSSAAIRATSRPSSAECTSWAFGASRHRSTAISGIELALWDIFGKSLGLPVWRLLAAGCETASPSTPLGLGKPDAVYGTFEPQDVAERPARSWR